MLTVVSRLSKITNSLAEKIALTLVIILTVLTMTGVIYRYVLQMPLVWLYETTVVVFAWMVFIGASIAFKRREHIKLEFLVDSVPESAARFIKIIIELITIIFLIFVIKEGFQIVKDTSAQTYNTIDLSIAWFYASFPVSALFMIIHLFDAVLELLFKGKELTE